ncbi:uncharacterized protein PRCAT00001160001 [Priceomyces carsonii]|uniref:uncharacterized protein n=1 Tax=Priceomyces carsonii TaxID=28549 RepID=UPI002ED96205|nr:unnamed protein product [Priceomyces carsonii]
MNLEDDVLLSARVLLQNSQPTAALELLGPKLRENEHNVDFLQTFGEVLLENNEMEEAYNILMKACEMDMEAERGSEKFFNLGQIIGGEDGLKLLDVGLNRLQQQLKLAQRDMIQQDSLLVDMPKNYAAKELLLKHLIKKINQGIFAKIEIWMTDLCMELEAESQCDSLIENSISLDSRNPEAFSLLASIRISQQRTFEAKEALEKSWDLFQHKKTALEETVSKHQEDEMNEELLESSMEYGELIQALLNLSRLAIELELYELVSSVTSRIQDMNENILECYYYGALASLLQAKKLFTILIPKIADYREVSNASLKSSSDQEIQALIHEAKVSLTIGYKIINSESIDADTDLIEQMSDLLDEFGGPVMSELMPQKINETEEAALENELNLLEDV